MKPWGRVFKIKKKSRLVERRGMRRSTVAHFACKVRGTNVERASTRRKFNKVMPQIFAMRPFPSLIHASIPSKIQSVFMEIAKRFIRHQKDCTNYLLAAAGNATRGRQ